VVLVCLPLPRALVNRVPPQGARALATALKGHIPLITISLESNTIGAGGAGAIGTALETNNALESINLGDNSIGDNGGGEIHLDGLPAIAAALETNSTLESLDLWLNDIGVDGARAIALALETNTTLSDLDLQSNLIGDEGMRLIATALQGNTTLASLDLEDNNIGADAGHDAFRTAFSSNFTLCELGGIDGVAGFVERNQLIMRTRKQKVPKKFLCVGFFAVASLFSVTVPSCCNLTAGAEALQPRCLPTGMMCWFVVSMICAQLTSVPAVQRQGYGAPDCKNGVAQQGGAFSMACYVVLMAFRRTLHGMRQASHKPSGRPAMRRRSSEKNHDAVLRDIVCEGPYTL
jgi:hypothetical protein